LVLIGYGRGCQDLLAGRVGSAVFGSGEGICLNLLGEGHPLGHPLDDTLPLHGFFAVRLGKVEVALDQRDAGFVAVVGGERLGTIEFECSGIHRLVIQIGYKVEGEGVSRLAVDVFPLGSPKAFFGLLPQGFSKGQIEVMPCGIILIHCLVRCVFEVGGFSRQPSPLLYIPQSSGHFTQVEVRIVSSRVEDIIGERNCRS